MRLYRDTSDVVGANLNRVRSSPNLLNEDWIFIFIFVSSRRYIFAKIEKSSTFVPKTVDWAKLVGLGAYF